MGKPKEGLGLGLRLFCVSFWFLLFNSFSSIRSQFTGYKLDLKSLGKCLIISDGFRKKKR